MGTIRKSLADALFSKVQQRVLGLLYGQPDLAFHTNNIIRLTHSGSGAVQRELEKLVSAGIVTKTQIGNQIHYQANRAMPFFAELRGIILKTFGLADVIQNALQQLSPKKISFAFIYGSIAKQEDTATSDIDLMLISDKLTYADLFRLLEQTEKQLGRRINPTFYSPDDWMKKCNEKNNFVMQILQQPKIFLIGTEDGLIKLG